ncbi:MAG: hypothetical protein ABW133_01745 [Polyangiaceae bacterium]
MPASTSSSGKRFFVLFLGAAAIAAGGWYLQNGGWTLNEQETSEEEEEEGFGIRVDAGAPKKRAKKGGGSAKKRSSEAKVRTASEEATPKPPPGPSGPSGPSYESAIAGNNLELAPGTKDVPDLTDGQLSYPMREGTFLDTCGVPASTKVTVKVAIRNGHAVGVSVYATPPNREMAWCVERQVRGLSWPSNGKMDSFITTY